ncbi:MAG: Acid phosphatase, partial [Thermoleophilia bacterium]|nr:Acid phosphatase [Thermoleophilia bacterium]
MVNHASQVSKAAAARARPFVDDPTLTVAIDKPGNNPSYPSGHSSGAYAGAEVLAYLMPDRAAEFMNIAAQVAYSRLYGGVHYPSDVIAGAKIASTITAVLTRSTMAKPKRGLRPKAGNGGVAGGRHALLPQTASAALAPAPVALLGAVHLAGVALPGAVVLAA